MVNIAQRMAIGNGNRGVTPDHKGIGILLAALAWSGSALSAIVIGEQIHDRVLQSVETVIAAGAPPAYEIRLAVPAHYAWHFPKAPSREILIALRLIDQPRDINGRSDYREHLPLPGSVREAVQDIRFESNQGHGSFIILQFKTPVTVTVVPGTDAYRITFIIHQSRQDSPGSIDQEKHAD